MTLQDLKEYQYLETDIMINEQKLKELRNNPPSNEASKVKGSSDRYPFTQRTFFVGYGDSVSNVSPKAWQEKKDKLEGEIACQTDTFRKLKVEVESFLASLKAEDLFMMNSFMSGLTQGQVGELIHLDQPGVSKRMNRLIENWNTIHI